MTEAERIRVTETAERDLVAVTVGGRGELRELHLDPRLYLARDPEALAAEIVDAVAEARKALRDKGLAALPEGCTDPELDPALAELDRIIATRRAR